MKTLLSIALCILGVKAWWSELEVSGVENSDSGIIKTDFKVSRFNKTTYTISGDFEFTENVDDRYDGLYTMEPDPVSKDMVVKYVDVGVYKGEFIFYNKAADNISSMIVFYLKLY